MKKLTDEILKQIIKESIEEAEAQPNGYKEPYPKDVFTSINKQGNDEKCVFYLNGQLNTSLGKLTNGAGYYIKVNNGKHAGQTWYFTFKPNKAYCKDKTLGYLTYQWLKVVKNGKALIEWNNAGNSGNENAVIKDRYVVCKISGKEIQPETVFAVKSNGSGGEAYGVGNHTCIKDKISGSIYCMDGYKCNVTKDAPVSEDDFKKGTLLKNSNIAFGLSQRSWGTRPDGGTYIGKHIGLRVGVVYNLDGTEVASKKYEYETTPKVDGVYTKKAVKYPMSWDEYIKPTPTNPGHKGDEGDTTKKKPFPGWAMLAARAGWSKGKIDIYRKITSGYYKKEQLSQVVSAYIEKGLISPNTDGDPSTWATTPQEAFAQVNPFVFAWIAKTDPEHPDFYTKNVKAYKQWLQQNTRITNESLKRLVNKAVLNELKKLK